MEDEKTEDKSNEEKKEEKACIPNFYIPHYLR